MIKTIDWTDEGVRMIDQTKLPIVEEYAVFESWEGVAEAIRSMVIRGAPAIGVAAAMGIALGMKTSPAKNEEEARSDFKKISEGIASTRPTAVNLFWAIERMEARFISCLEEGLTLSEIRKTLVLEALDIHKNDIESNLRLGNFGQELLPSNATVLTHCNAGALATAGYGTALGVIRSAVEAGKRIRVLAGETRPFLQGSRLTAWELWKDNIDVRVIADNMSGALMRQGLIDAVIVGADRVARNGDVANKIGTYTVAILARQHEIPFYVAAPISTLDLAISSGSEIPIEQRRESELTMFAGVQLAPKEVGAFNPSFDVTPNEFVTAIITDCGVAYPPYEDSLERLVAKTTTPGF